MEICAIVVTYRRPKVVMRTLRAINQQSTPPDQVIVVDNDNDSSLSSLVSRELPTTKYVASPTNVGYGAALATGMRYARAHYDPRWYWLLDDDTPPAPDALEVASEVGASAEGVWVVANRGGEIRRGRIIHDFSEGGEVNEADFTLVDGALISKEAVDTVGFPREDFFMMFEDIDYTARIADCGGRLLVRTSEGTALHMGSGAGWRVYYQSRNHLRVAIERKSLPWILGWGWRTSALCLRDVKRRQWYLMGFRLLGALDATTNRMGSGRHSWLLSRQRVAAT